MFCQNSALIHGLLCPTAVHQSELLLAMCCPIVVLIGWAGVPARILNFLDLKKLLWVAAVEALQM